MVELATAWVRVVPSFDGVSTALAKGFTAVPGVETAGKNIGGQFVAGVSSQTKKLIGVLGAAFAVKEIADFVEEGLNALKRIETLSAQTGAVIKSTGGAANVTKDHILKLTQGLEDYTATEQETIQEGANMLLTFKGIRNEAGEGNDVYDQSVKALVDMARAMGGDMTSNAIRLGKALNDPIGGMTALQRVGIQFTDDQKNLIKSLVESGDVMGAQKVILQELNSEFGGSGAAFADTYAGRIELIKFRFGEVQEKIAEKVMPLLDGFATWMEGDGLTALNDFTDGVVGLVGGLDDLSKQDWFQGLIDALASGGELDLANGGFVENVKKKWAELPESFANGWEQIKQINKDASDETPKAFEDSWETRWKPAAENGWKQITDAFGNGWTQIQEIDDAATAEGGAASGLQTWWGGVAEGFGHGWEQITGAFANGWEQIAGGFGNGFNQIVTAFGNGWTQITDGVGSLWTSITTAFSNGWTQITGWWSRMWGDLGSALANGWSQITTGIASLWTTIVTAFSNGWTQITTWWSSMFVTIATTLSTWAANLTASWTSFWQGIGDFFSSLWQGVVQVFNTVRDNITAAIDKVSTVARNVQHTFEDVAKNIKAAFDGIGKFIADAFGGIGDFLSGPANAIANFFGGIGDKAAAFKGKVTQLAAQRSAAIGGGPAAPGTALARVQATLPAGLHITDTYSTPARDAAMGIVRSATSYHYDKANPAVDIAGPIGMLFAYADQLRAMGGWRQMLWQVSGHYDHIHVAHRGGVVDRDWPRMWGDRADERTARLQVGETVLPRDWAPSTVNRYDPTKDMNHGLRRAAAVSHGAPFLNIEGNVYTMDVEEFYDRAERAKLRALAEESLGSLEG